MDAITCLKERRSVRKFTEEAIPTALLEEIVEAARYAPSWKNSQTVRYIALYDPQEKAKLAETCTLTNPYNSKIICRSAVLVIVVSRCGVSGYEPDGTPSTPLGDHWTSFDAGIAAQSFCLAAHSKGVGTVILGIYDHRRVAELLELPEGEQVSALIAAGYPEKIGTAPARKSVGELLSIR